MTLGHRSRTGGDVAFTANETEPLRSTSSVDSCPSRCGRSVIAFGSVHRLADRTETERTKRRAVVQRAERLPFFFVISSQSASGTLLPSATAVAVVGIAGLVVATCHVMGTVARSHPVLGSTRLTRLFASVVVPTVDAVVFTAFARSRVSQVELGLVKEPRNVSTA